MSFKNFTLQHKNLLHTKTLLEGETQKSALSNGHSCSSFNNERVVIVHRTGSAKFNAISYHEEIFEWIADLNVISASPGDDGCTTELQAYKATLPIENYYYK